MFLLERAAQRNWDMQVKGFDFRGWRLLQRNVLSGVDIFLFQLDEVEIVW
jgi:hypothetical protein